MKVSLPYSNISISVGRLQPAASGLPNLPLDRFTRNISTSPQPLFGAFVPHSELPSEEEWEKKYFTPAIIRTILQMNDMDQVASISPVIVDIGAGRGTLLFPVWE